MARPQRLHIPGAVDNPRPKPALANRLERVLGKLNGDGRSLKINAQITTARRKQRPIHDSAPSNAKSLTAGALFAGIGGFCLGFARAGITTVWAIDNDEYAERSYRQNLPSPTFLRKDVRVTSARRDLEPVDVLHAGFPCQSFSQAGVRRGFHDERGRLFYEIPRIIAEFKDRKPKVLVLENSPYLRYGEGGAWFLELQRQIQKAGHWFREVNCAELDSYHLTELPQRRTRLYMVAFSIAFFRSSRFEFPHDRHLAPKRLTDYIDFDGQKPDEYYLPQGNRYYDMISEKASDRKSIYQLRKYMVRVKEPETCPTLTANMGLGGHNVPFVFDGRGLRKLTEQECLRLQGFPASFDFPEDVPRARRYIQIGNAVTVPVAELVAQRVKQKITSEHPDA